MEAIIFGLKKAVQGWLTPTGLIYILQVLTVLSIWKLKRPRWNLILAVASLVVLTLTSFDPLPDYFTRQLERVYPAHKRQPQSLAPHYIVVLSGGMVLDEALSVVGQLNPGTLARTIEGIRLAYLYPQATLIFSGGIPVNGVTEAQLMKTMALDLGFSPARILLESQSQDTKDQARYIKDMVGDRSMFLVTSAMHLYRAMQLFRAQKIVQVTAVPVGHLVRGPNSLIPLTRVPRSKVINQTDSYFHEILGLAWAKIRGQW